MFKNSADLVERAEEEIELLDRPSRTTSKELVGEIKRLRQEVSQLRDPDSRERALIGMAVANLRFPTMLRCMWSGGDVERWLKEQSESILNGHQEISQD